MKVSSVTYRLVPPLPLRLIAGAASPFYHLLTGSRCVHYSGKNIIAVSADAPSETRLNRGFLRQQADSLDVRFR